MNLMKRILCLSVTLALVGVLFTSCERDVIIEEDLEGVKSIEEVNDDNLRKGGKKIYLKRKSLKAYSEHLISTRKLNKRELVEVVTEVTLEELLHAGIIGSQLGGVIILPFNPILPDFSSDCGDLPNGDTDVGCDCRDLLYDLYIDAFYDCLFFNESCDEVDELNCNFNVAAGNCVSGQGPLEDCP